MRTLPLLGLIAVAGCRSGPRPPVELRVGQEWSYIVGSGFQTYVETARVVRPAPVEGADGVLVEGPLGTSRLGVSGERLVLASTPDAVIRPPLPLFVPTSAVWHGRVEFRDATLPAGGRIETSDVELPVGGRTLKCRLSVAKIRVGDEPVEIRTWFHAGSGIVQQEQRTNGLADQNLKLLRSPDDRP